jgi:DNA-binding MarR family transcriptional regulator
MNINEKLSSVIFSIGRLVREKVQESCPADFTQTEIEVLKLVGNNKNTSMKDVADYLHIKPPSATPLIDSMVKKGTLKRIKDKNDRRIVHIAATSKGMKFLQKKYKAIHKTLGKVFGRLSEKDKKNLIKIFEKMRHWHGYEEEVMVEM